MKFFIITKKKILTMCFCAIAAVLSVIISLNTVSTAIETATEKKKIPIYCVEKNEKSISISFDAAWGNEQTQELIDILAKYNIKTTFFVVGEWVDKYPESVKALSDAGHEVCNHSNTHPHLTKMDEGKIKDEIEKCNQKICSITGVSPVLFRAPYGDYDNKVVNTVESMNMYCIQWDVEPSRTRGMIHASMVNHRT